MQRSFPELNAIADRLINKAAQQQMSVYTSLAMAFTYRELSDDVIDAYIDHLSTPAGRAYSNAVFDGLEQAMFNASARYGQSLVKVFTAMATESTS